MLTPVSKNKLKFFRRLQQKKFRKEQGLYLISGLRAVREACKSKDLKIKYILLEEKQTALLNELPRLNCEAIFTLNSKEFALISDVKTPQGIAVVAGQPKFSLSSVALPDKVIYLEQIGDPGNLGTIIRSALWFGWNTVLLGKKSVDPFQPKAVRSSAGSIARITLVENVSADDIKTLKQKNRYKLVGATVRKGDPLNGFQPALNDKLLLAFGSEAHGLSEELDVLCDVHLTIPCAGAGESLNLAIATSLFLYQIYLTQEQTIRKDKQ
ncbi:MAG: RNA methyltransferase [Calditrichaeota bacterium]|nr:RNA methyltransferase [Calditrichota bacterium]